MEVYTEYNVHQRHGKGSSGYDCKRTKVYMKVHFKITKNVVRTLRCNKRPRKIVNPENFNTAKIIQNHCVTTENPASHPDLRLINLHWSPCLNLRLAL